MKHYIGSTEVEKIYIGNDLYFEKENSADSLPVQNGLICWLDARDSIQGTKLLDRQGNYDAVISGTGYVQEDNVIKITDSTYLTNLAVTGFDNTEYTVEVYFKVLGNNFEGKWNTFGTTPTWSKSLLFGYTPDHPNNLAISMEGFNRITTSVGLDEYVVFTYVKTASNVGKLYLDGAFEKELGDFKLDFINLGLAAGTPFQNIGSCKVYNRALTEGEILQNYDYERSINREQPQNTVIQDGLVCWLDASEGSGTTWTDKSGSGNNGSLIGFNEDCWIDDKLAFDNSEVQISMEETNARGFTISLSFYNTNFPDSDNPVFDATNEIELYYHTNIIETFLKGQIVNFATGGSNGVIDLVIDNADMKAKLYKNGVLFEEKNINNEIRTLTNPRIGADRWGGKFAGEIGRVLIYNRALTDNEVLSNIEYEKSLLR